MKKFRLKYFFLAILSGFLTAISFPKINAFYFIWIAFIPIIYVSLRNCVKNSLVYGFVFGFTNYAVSLFWMFPFLKYNTNTIQSLIVSFLLWSYLSLYFAFWTGGLSFSRRHFNPIISSLYAASSWAMLECMRTCFLTGFGWNLLGYSQASFSYIIQIADIFGVYGVSFAVIFINMLLYYWLSTSKGTKYVLYALSIFLLIFIYGYIKINKYANPYGEKISIGVVQPNIDQYKKWDEKYSNEIINTIKQDTEYFKGKNLDLIVYPETVLPGYLQYEGNIIDLVEEVSSYSKMNLFSGPSYDDNGIYNSVFAVTEKGKVLERHDKNHLVIFGEFIPFKTILSKYFGILNSLGDFSKGKYMNVLKFDNLFVGTTICSENFFPLLSRKLVLNGAKILTNHTNDAWFFDSYAPYQHFVMNIFRAVENRKNVIVAANTGISAVIDSTGDIMRKTDLNEDISFTSEAYQNDVITVYDRIGNAFCFLCMFFTMFIIVIVFII
ncbi:MAG: apolipoprotein N-acyltransferase [Endomicrobiaceae bacterium]|nr:apolipoprotein N-acyltransferase [Endomicrobiaceae bacterium]